MKTKSLRVVITLVCVLALSLSLVGGAFAAPSALDLETVAAMAQKALDNQEIQNIMSRHVMYHCYGEHEEEMLEIWVQEPENQATASFGQNQGFFVGYDAIWDAYVVNHDTAWKTAALSYLSKQGIDTTNMTDEEIAEYYGVGQLLLHVTTTAIIEVAADGQTAQAFWYSPGMIAESGQSANSIWEIYGVDFVKENGEWKMWHLHMYTDFMSAFGDTFTSSSSAAGGAPMGDKDTGMPSEGGGQIAFEGEAGEQLALAAGDYLSAPQYSEFSSDRLLAEMEVVLIPLAYDTWSFDAQNYGPTAEQYGYYGIDLQAWYDAH